MDFNYIQKDRIRKHIGQDEVFDVTYVVFSQPDYALSGEMRSYAAICEWLRLNTKGKHYAYLNSFFFSDIDDAMAFKLKFGGTIQKKNIKDAEGDWQ